MPPKVTRKRCKGYKDLVNNAGKLGRSGKNLVSLKLTLYTRNCQVQGH